MPLYFVSLFILSYTKLVKPIISSSLHSPYSSLCIKLVQVQLLSGNRMLFHICTGYVLDVFSKLYSGFPVFEANQWCTYCGKPSVIILVKVSLYHWHWNRHVYLLEDVVHLANSCKRVFPHLGKIHLSSTTVVLHDLLVFLSSPMHFFISLLWVLF